MIEGGATRDFAQWPAQIMAQHSQEQVAGLVHLGDKYLQ
jgi:hypothetical protein